MQLTKAIGTALAAALLGAPALVLAQDQANGDWAHYGGDIGDTKYSPLDAINAGNIDQLKVVWRAPATDPTLPAANPDLRLSNNYRHAPLVVDGVMYLSNQLGHVEARDPGSGQVLWRQTDFGPDVPLGGAQASRAIAFWRDGEAGRIVSVRSPWLYVLDAASGALVESFGDGGRVDIRPGPDTIYNWNYPAPIVVGDVIVIGGQPIAIGVAEGERVSLPGDIRGFDIRTGALRWTFHTVPREGEPGVETWEDESWRQGGKTKVWSGFSADEELGYVYVALSAPTPVNDYDGRDRPGDNLYSDSLVALDASTGEKVWHFQTVHHDLWDYDLPTPPMLADIRVNGKVRKAAIQVTKTAYVFAFDRETGESLFPVVEVPVQQAIVEGEYTSPTQPMPMKPAPFDRQHMDEDALIDFTPDLHAEAVEIMNRYVHGPMYTPPTIAGGDDGKLGTLYLPGWVGGANWTGAALDPETGVAYIPSVTVPWISRYEYQRPPDDQLYLDGPQGLPLVKPPYGRITAIDMDSGDHLWMAANGDGPRDHPLLKDLDLPPLGQSGRAAPLLTRTFLFMGEGDAVGLSLPKYSGGNMFRAYDKQTGEVAWEMDLGAGTTAPPISYMFEGRQYIVVAIGGVDYPAELVALSVE